MAKSIFTIVTPRGHEVDIEADDEATAIRGAQEWDLQDFAGSEAEGAGLDPALVRAQMRQESGNDPKAVSPKGARGPMQLMPATAQELGVDPDDPYDNIRGGVRYLKQQRDRFGDDDLALAAYNAGPGAVEKYGGIPPFPETQKYAAAIRGADKAPAAAVPEEPLAKPPPALPGAPKNLPQKTSQELGLIKGLLPVQEKIDKLYPALSIPNLLLTATGLRDDVGKLTSLMGLPQRGETKSAASRARLAEAEREGVAPGMGGEFAGNVISTIGMPGGPMVSGALTGAALDEGDDIGSIGRNALYGAIGGKLGSSAVGGFGKLISGVTDDAVQRLAKQGVPMTLGQMSGGMVKGIEDRLEGLPVVGGVINNARRRSVDAFNRASFDDVLGEIGARLPKEVPTGHDAYNYTKGFLKEAYDAVLEPLEVVVDQPAAKAVMNLRAQAAKLPEDLRGTFKGILEREIYSRIGPDGRMSGEGMKAVQEALRGHIDDLMKGKKWERDAAGLVESLKTELEGLVERTSSEAGAELKAVNRAYSKFKPVERAVGNAAHKGGTFTGAELVRSTGVGKGPAAKAGGRLPQLQRGQDAAKVLPNTVPESGTAGRLMIPGLLSAIASGQVPALAPLIAPALPALTSAAGLASLYTRGGQKLLTGAMTSRNPGVRQVGNYIRKLAAPAGTVGAVALPASRQ